MDKEKMYQTFIQKSKELFPVDNDPLSKENLEQHLGRDLWPNQFLTIGDLSTGKIETYYTLNIEKVLGYKPNEFTEIELYKIVSDEHLILAMEFALIAISLLNEEDIKFDRNYAYIIEFSAIIKGENFRLRRFCWVYDIVKGKRYLHCDIWTDVTQKKGNSKYVAYSFQTPSNEFTKKIYDKFHKKWTKESLEFWFTDKQLKVIEYLIDGKKRTEISKKMGIKKSMVDEHVKNAKGKVNDFIDRCITKQHRMLKDEIKFNLIRMIAKEPIIKEEKELLNFAKKYNLLRYKNN